MVQFESWQAVLPDFACLNAIQLVVGSYIERRLSGNVLAMSPFVVVFSIFLWTFLRGLPGTFMGVPIAVTLTLCAKGTSSRRLALLLRPPDQPSSVADRYRRGSAQSR